MNVLEMSKSCTAVAVVCETRPPHCLLNCVHGNFKREIDHHPPGSAVRNRREPPRLQLPHLYSYTGECEHWERAIASQVLDAIEINSEYIEEIEQPFQQIAEQCPAWEMNL